VVKAIGYTRVSTDEQSISGLGLAAQRSAIEADANKRGWSLSQIFEDAGASGRTLQGRPGVSAALRALKERQAEALIVSKLDRLSRSVADFAHLLDLSTKQGWSLVLLDLGVDTSTPTGEAMAYVVGAFSQMERRLIGERTRVALQQARERGTKLGAPVLVAAEVETRIVTRRKQGATLQQIASELDRDQIQAPRKGPMWRHATIRQILRRHNVPSYPRGRRPRAAG
jgi:DNA invertase Pin-like site-specific DNA recombinase